MGLSIPFNHSVNTVRGAAAESSIALGGILSGSRLLAVIKHDAGTGVIAGLDPSDFTVSAGEIESASEDTSGHALTVIWTDSPEPD